MDTLLYVVKYCAAIVSGVYGIYATVHDFHEKKHGKSVLTNYGRAGIALLIFSTVLSLSSDTIKDTREHRQAKADEAKRDELLIEAKRASARFSTDRISGFVSITLANDITSVRRYLDRLKKEHFDWRDSSFFQEGQKGFPDRSIKEEYPFFLFVTKMVADVEIFKTSNHTVFPLQTFPYRSYVLYKTGQKVRATLTLGGKIHLTVQPIYLS
jgi:hypothetical protein